jgi:hypothetical protein
MKSNFTVNGLDIGKNDNNLTYLYGLSDFWSYIYEDKDKINLLLEADAVKLSDIYSKFLQLASTISIEDIITSTHQQIKLVFINATDEVIGEVNTFTMPETIISANAIANRPLLPTVYLENEIHYRISDDGKQIQFYNALNTLGFPTRTLPDGTKQYALWFVDVRVDEQFLYDFYGKLIGVSPEISTDNFKNFLYGLYFLYANGPNLDTIRKGLNLTLGIPLARETETVLDVRKYLDSDQFLVTTDLNSYLIPYGLEPSVAMGDILNATDELAQWIEVKDWVNDDGWWLNLHIPEKVLPYIPAGEVDRYAIAGSYADRLMRDFLKYHTFLVNVKTIDFKNLQSFSQLSDIINQVKPTYTTPIYIWTVPTTKEKITFDDGELHFTGTMAPCDDLTMPSEKMVRNNALWAFFGTDKRAEITVSGDRVSKNTISASYHGARANMALAPGEDHYFEYKFISLQDSTQPSFNIGLGNAGTSLTSQLGTTSATEYAFRCGTNTSSFKRTNAVDTSYSSSPVAGDVYGFYVRLSAGQGNITMYKNGVSQGTMFTGLDTTGAVAYYPMTFIAQPTGTIPLKIDTAVIANAGTGYAVGDVLTFAGGTFTQPALASVRSVDGSGGITSINLIDPGIYTVVPGTPNSPTGGSGVGATITRTTAAYSTVIEVNFGAKNFSYPVPSPDTTNPGVYSHGTQLLRGCAKFTRMNVDHHMGGILGAVDQINGAARSYEGGIVKGFINYIHQFRENTYREAAWLRMFQTGTQDIYIVPDDFINFPTGVTSFYDNSGVGVRTFNQADPSMRVIPLYVTTQADIENKYAAFGSTAPGLDTWTFTFAASNIIDPVIDEAELDAELVLSNYSLLVNSFDTLFFREIADLGLALPPGKLSDYRQDTANYLKKFMPLQGYETWAPTVDDLKLGDYLLFIRIMDDVVGVYWVTSNLDINAPYIRVSEKTDPIGIEYDAAVSRQHSMYSTWYVLRGAGLTQAAGVSSVSGINMVGINSAEPGAADYITYTDDYNIPPVQMDRSGKIITHRRDFK